MKFKESLNKAVAFHGDVCVGLVLGVRMVIASLRELGIKEPSEMRNLIVFVEVDRCLADAIQATTGCTLGKRRLKFINYGKFGATFVDISKNTAVRVSVSETARSLAERYVEEKGLTKRDAPSNWHRWMKAVADFYSNIPERDLLDVRRVSVKIPRWDLPGRPQSKVACAQCGEIVFDRREVVVGGRMLCKACAEGAYYKLLDESSTAAGSPTNACKQTAQRNSLG